MAVDYTYQNSTGDRTTEFVSSYKNVVTPTTGTATNVEYTYTYDANGNIVSDSLGSTLKHSYVYDEAGQLVRVNDAVQNKTFCYTYDNGGNLIYKKRYAYTTGTLGSVLQTMATYAYSDSNWKDKLTSYNNISLSYDAIGNLTNFDDRSFTWTTGRQLAGFELYTDDYAVSYKYNADGLRTQKYIDDDQTYTDTTYDYIWADGKLVSQTDGTDVLYFLYDSNDSPTGFVLNDAATYLYIKNLQGDITGIADENGAIIVNYTYDEWGKLLSLTDNSLDGIIGELNPLRYRGYYYDTETGYYYLQSRYYNPSWGRFINADAIAQVNGSNLYAYCGNNPVIFVDYTGTDFFSIIIGFPKMVNYIYSLFRRLIGIVGRDMNGKNIYFYQYDNTFSWPVPYKNTYIPEGYPNYHDGDPHNGIDICLQKGTSSLGKNIVAAKSGTITYSGVNGDYGNCIKIDHGDGLSTLYAHCNELLVSNGNVTRGQVIATIGETGSAKGPHLHFEVRVDNIKVDPLSYRYLAP